MQSMRNILNSETLYRLKVGGGKMIYHANTNQKKPGWLD